MFLSNWMLLLFLVAVPFWGVAMIIVMIVTSIQTGPMPWRYTPEPEAPEPVVYKNPTHPFDYMPHDPITGQRKETDERRQRHPRP